MKLDYSSLNQPVTTADITAFQHSQSQQQTSSRQIYIALGVIALVFLVIFFVIPLLTSGNGIELGSLGYLGAIAIFFGLIIVVTVVATKIQTKKLAKLYRFALHNNLTLKANISNPTYAGAIFDERNGHSRTISQALAFPDGSEIGNYHYTTGSGKNSQMHVWTYARVQLKRQLPNMLLDSKKNNMFGTFSNLPNSMKSGQMLSLEGDFNKYFTLYAPVEYKQDALYVFTPDVMAAIIDAGQDYDIEVIGDSLFLYRSQTISIDSELELTKILSILNRIGGELLDQSSNYTDQRVGNRAENTIAQQGQQLKHRIKPSTIILVAAILFLTFVPMMISLIVSVLR